MTTIKTPEIMNAFIEKVNNDKEYTLDDLHKIMAEVYGKFYKSKSDKVEKTKKKPSSYNMYVKAKIEELKKESPEKKAVELMAMAASQWKDLSQEQKDSYKQK